MAYRNYDTAVSHIVDPNGFGDFTTIGSALTAAGAGPATIFIRPGTYTENLTLPANINLTAYGCDSSLNGTGTVIISGTITKTSAGSSTISGIQLQTNSAALLSVTGTLASIVNLINCYLNCTNNTGITFSVANTAAAINLNNCFGNLGTTGIGYFSDSSTGTISFSFCSFSNTGVSLTANTKSAGVISIFSSSFTNPITYSSSSILPGIINSNFSAVNTTNITTSGTGALSIVNCQFNSGTASSISIGTGTQVAILLSMVNSSNTNAITGAGTIIYSSITFLGSSNTINVTTQPESGTLQGSKNTAPAAGYLGEYISATGSAVGLANGTAGNITSISLTAGIWDVSMNALITYSVAPSATGTLAGISATSATITGSTGDSNNQTTVVATQLPFSICAFRVTLSATTTYYLVGKANFASGSALGYGRISGTRVG